MNEEAILWYESEAEKDEDGYVIEESKQKVEFDVFVKEKSVTRQEFYQSMQAGIRPTIVFEMRREEYEQTAHIVGTKRKYATCITYDGAEYEILRAYSKDKTMIELTCK